jgi:KaiC/GvpD/RAD55 family RecA-like ATPase
MPVVLQSLPAIRRSEVTMFAGQPGAGKSLLALWHAQAWVSEGLRGLYFSADSAELGQASRALAMTLVNLSVSEAEEMLKSEDEWALAQMHKLNNLSWSFEDDLSYENINEEVMAFVELWGCYPDFIIVDNLTDVEGQSEDEWATQRRALKALVQLARHTDSATLVLHHTSEDEKEDPCPGRRAIMGKCNQKPAMIWTTADHGGRRPIARVKDRYNKGADKSGRTAQWFYLNEENLHWTSA